MKESDSPVSWPPPAPSWQSCPNKNYLNVACLNLDRLAVLKSGEERSTDFYPTAEKARPALSGPRRAAYGSVSWMARSILLSGTSQMRATAT